MKVCRTRFQSGRRHSLVYLHFGTVGQWLYYIQESWRLDPLKSIPTVWPAGRPLQKSVAAIMMDRLLDVGARGPRRERRGERC